ncbi:hypothetical protein MKQ70_00155 [Chitinophaga sedimenti]|uniref:hypothetical protein n=1 Tax=Chitinophaga sedimenti TaxID=2033606 RepID=UPI002006763C|nr:hypothetical protein [Chitinophaga sedimenti]MCK7553499.1 hypothetical protein [Chitinophaga sedimenti]
MLHWIKSILGADPSPQYSWVTAKSLFQFVSEHIDLSGKLDEKALVLPDEEPLPPGADLRYAAGLKDALAAISEQGEEEVTQMAEQVVQLLQKVATRGDITAGNQLFNFLVNNGDLMAYIDPVLERVVQLNLEIEPHLYLFAKLLTFECAHRNGVKFGMALLGLCRRDEVLPMLRMLGLHDEFTIYSTIAIIYLSPDPETDLWNLARQVDGWGRVQVVDRLALLAEDEAVKDWLVREGYRNSIMYEYLAYTCALHGELHEKLDVPAIDKQLFAAAGDLLEAMIMGGPAEDINEYEFAAPAIENYVRHARTLADNVHDFYILHEIGNYIALETRDWKVLRNNGWTQDLRSNVLIDIMGIIQQPGWHKRVMAGLQSEESVEYYQAKEAAKILRINTEDIFWHRLRMEPTNSNSWYDVLDHGNGVHIDDAVRYAMETLLQQNVDNEGAAIQAGLSLDFLVNALAKHPGKGETLLLAALQSTQLRSRSMAVRTLSVWEQDDWTPALRDALLRLGATEPHESLRHDIRKVLSGEILDDEESDES